MTHAAFWIAPLKIIWHQHPALRRQRRRHRDGVPALPPRQRFWGMILGAGVAVLLRVIFTVVIAQAMNYPYLKMVGGLLLF